MMLYAYQSKYVLSQILISINLSSCYMHWILIDIYTWFNLLQNIYGYHGIKNVTQNGKITLMVFF